MNKHKTLTLEQKLHAISDKHYNGLVWNPKKGDYYTSVRNDLELYQIVDEDDEYFYTTYCHQECEADRWEKETFLQDFGIHRVLVSNYILE